LYAAAGIAADKADYGRCLYRKRISSGPRGVRKLAASFDRDLLPSKNAKEKSMPNVIGIFADSSQAHQAIDRMIHDQIDRDHISLVSRNIERDKAARSHKQDTRGESAENARELGTARMGLATPGRAPLLASGPIAAALGGALGEAGLGAAASGLIGVLMEMGVSEEEAKRYEEQIRQGNVLITVRAANESEADRVASIMDVGGAVDVEGASESGNTEAAPEYEGARADETSDTRRDRISRSRESAGDQPAPSDHEWRRHTGTGAGRIRVYGERS
jgi:hypothetical protein